MGKGPLKTDWKQNMVYLYQFSRTPHLPNLSPYCFKLETWLRLAQIPYEVCETMKTSNGPEGTLPFVELNGSQISDTEIIIRELTRAFSKESMEAGMDDHQKGVARAIERMTEDSMLRSFAFRRTNDFINEFFSREIFGPNAPKWITSAPVRKFYQRRVISQLKGHGIAKHKTEDIVRIGLEDMRALSKILGNNPFFGGEKPAKVDCTAFGHMAQIIYLPIKLEHQDLLNSDECKNLRDYCDHMKQNEWPDWEEVCAPAKIKRSK